MAGVIKFSCCPSISIRPCRSFKHNFSQTPWGNFFKSDKKKSPGIQEWVKGQGRCDVTSLPFSLTQYLRNVWSEFLHIWHKRLLGRRRWTHENMSLNRCTCKKQLEWLAETYNRETVIVVELVSHGVYSDIEKIEQISCLTVHHGYDLNPLQP